MGGISTEHSGLLRYDFSKENSSFIFRDEESEKNLPGPL
jgi:hypothetical protein